MTRAQMPLQIAERHAPIDESSSSRSSTSASPTTLFVREKKELRAGITAPYQYLGPLDYVSSAGSRPVAFTWKLRVPMPEDTFEAARAVAA